jgi:cytochrome c oxidase assembly protein subunit 15
MAAIGSTGSEAGTDQASWDQPVQAWLAFVALLVLAMITVGGATRLTDSGLSITEWQPILGAIPPLTDAHWLEAFAKYQQIPEYHLVNKGMSLEAFKAIYWWEWSHRFLGRMIGVAFGLPLLFFWLKGALRPGYPAKLAGVLALGALQGGIGWFMVKSGLVDRVDVSQYRLALHLTVAFLILALVVWLALSLGRRGETQASSKVPTLAPWILGAVLLQVVLGAFVAGLKAGLLYNTWPSMNGMLIPDDLLAMEPWYLNPFENPSMAQFDHRLVAYAVLVLAAVEVWRLARAGTRSEVKGSSHLLLAAVVAQAALGIWTLLHAVPLHLGIAHQAGAALVLIVAVRHLHVTRRVATP